MLSSLLLFSLLTRWNGHTIVSSFCSCVSFLRNCATFALTLWLKLPQQIILVTWSGLAMLMRVLIKLHLLFPSCVPVYRHSQSVTAVTLNRSIVWQRNWQNTTTTTTNLFLFVLYVCQRLIVNTTIPIVTVVQHTNNLYVGHMTGYRSVATWIFHVILCVCVWQISTSLSQ